MNHESHGAQTPNNDVAPILQQNVGQGYEYGSWLRPPAFTPSVENYPENVNQEPTSRTNEQEPAQPNLTPIPQNRRRGRPRVAEIRNESAKEKRRAQVRNAQRAYQQRKDAATKDVNQSCDEVLQVLSELSTEVEELLSVASKARTLDEDDDVGIHMRRLWDAYDTAINRPSVAPRLTELRVKNDQRQTEHQGRMNCEVAKASNDHAPETGRPTYSSLSDTDIPSARSNDTTLLQPFRVSTSSRTVRRSFAVLGTHPSCKESA